MKNILTTVIIILAILISFYLGYSIRGQTCKTLDNDSVVVDSTERTQKPDEPKPQVVEEKKEEKEQPEEQPKEPEKEPETESIFTNFNIYAVQNSPTNPTVFTTTKARTIYMIQDYHWNNATGKTPGTISLKSEDGTIFGPWNAEGSPGQGGVPNAYWTVKPKVEIPAGTYTIIDSDPTSWAQNSGTNGSGMSQVSAIK